MAEKNSLWKNIRNKAAQNRASGATPNQPTTEMLRQERKIKAKKADGGPVGDDDLMLSKIYSKYPAFKNMGNVTLKADPSFTKEKTGLGEIEYFSPTQDTITYPTEYKYPHPNLGTHGIVYNPNIDNVEESVRLDLLHGMPISDKVYAKHRDEFGNSFKKENQGEIDYWWSKEKEKYGDGDGKESFEKNYIDGVVRGLLLQGNPEDMGYSAEANKYYLQNPEVSKREKQLENYLQIGKGYMLPEVEIFDDKTKAKGGSVGEDDDLEKKLTDLRKQAAKPASKVPTAQENFINATKGIPKYNIDPNYQVPIGIHYVTDEERAARPYPASGKLDIDPGAELLPFAVFEAMRIPGLVKNYKYNMNHYKNAPVIGNINLAHPRNLMRARKALNKATGIAVAETVPEIINAEGGYYPTQGPGKALFKGYANGGYNINNNNKSMKNNTQSWKEYLKYAQGGRTNPYNQYQDDQYLQYEVGGKVWKNIAAGLYGAGEGILDTVTMGATDELTDKGFEALSKAGNKNIDLNNPDDVKFLKSQQKVKGYSNAAGAIGTAAVTGNVQGAIKQGTKGLNTAFQATDGMSDNFKKWSQGVTGVAGVASGFAGGLNSSGFSAAQEAGTGVAGFGQKVGKYSPLINQASGFIGGNEQPLWQQGQAEQNALNSPDKLAQDRERNESYTNQGLMYGQGGNMSNNSLNLRNTMGNNRFASGGAFEQYGINMIPDSAGLHHQSAYGGVPIGPNALAEGGEIKMDNGNGSQYIVSDQVDGAETQKDFTFSKGGKYKELNRTLADGMKQDLNKYTFGSLATSDRVKSDLRRPNDSYGQSTVDQIKEKWQQKTEYARQRSQHDQAIAQAEEQKRMAEEQYVAAYGGRINPKKYPGLNMTKKAKGGYIHNQMTQPMYAKGGPTDPPLTPEELKWLAVSLRGTESADYLSGSYGDNSMPGGNTDRVKQLNPTQKAQLSDYMRNTGFGTDFIEAITPNIEFFNPKPAKSKLAQGGNAWVPPDEQLLGMGYAPDQVEAIKLADQKSPVFESEAAYNDITRKAAISKARGDVRNENFFNNQKQSKLDAALREGTPLQTLQNSQAKPILSGDLQLNILEDFEKNRQRNSLGEPDENIEQYNRRRARENEINKLEKRMQAEGGPLYGDPASPYTYAMGGEDKPWNAPMPIGPFGNTQPQPTRLSPGMQQLQDRFDAAKAARNGAPLHANRPTLSPEQSRRALQDVFIGQRVGADGRPIYHNPYATHFSEGGAYEYAFGGEDKVPSSTRYSSWEDMKMQMNAARAARPAKPVLTLEQQRAQDRQIMGKIGEIFSSHNQGPNRINPSFPRPTANVVNPAFQNQLQNTNALTRARGGQIDYTTDMYSMYAGGGPMPSNLPQAFNGPSAQNRGGMYLYPNGGPSDIIPMPGVNPFAGNQPIYTPSSSAGQPILPPGSDDFSYDYREDPGDVVSWSSYSEDPEGVSINIPTNDPRERNRRGNNFDLRDLGRMWKHRGNGRSSGSPQSTRPGATICTVHPDGGSIYYDLGGILPPTGTPPPTTEFNFEQNPNYLVNQNQPILASQSLPVDTTQTPAPRYNPVTSTRKPSRVFQEDSKGGHWYNLDSTDPAERKRALEANKANQMKQMNVMPVMPTARAEGGMMPPEQQMQQDPQQQQMQEQQGGGQEQQMMQMVEEAVNMLSQMPPEQVMGELVKMGVPEDMAMQIVQVAMQEAGGQMEQQQGQQPMQEGQQMPPQQGMARGGYYNGKKQYYTGGTEDEDENLLVRKNLSPTVYNDQYYDANAQRDYDVSNAFFNNVTGDKNYNVNAGLPPIISTLPKVSSRPTGEFEDQLYNVATTQTGSTSALAGNQPNTQKEQAPMSLEPLLNVINDQNNREQLLSVLPDKKAVDDKLKEDKLKEDKKNENKKDNKSNTITEQPKNKKGSNMSATDLAFMAAQLAGPAYQFFQKKPKPFQYQKAQPTKLDPSTAIMLAEQASREAEAGSGYAIRQAAPTAGSYLANIRANALNSAKQRGQSVAGIRGQYDLQNAGIQNQFEQYNTELTNKATDAMQQDEANYQEQRTNALYNAGANLAGMRKDYKAGEIDQLIANNIGTNNYKYDQAKQTITYKKSDGKEVTVPVSTVLGGNTTT